MLPVKVKHNIKVFLERMTGLTISSHNNDFEKFRFRLVAELDPDLVVDCGANCGQWGLRLKGVFPEVNLHSFEPIYSTFVRLKEVASKYENWRCINAALSSHSGVSTIKVASNQGMSSSLSNPSLHISVHPDIDFEKTEEVSLTTLDQYKYQFKKIFLKIDVQGHEYALLMGAIETLESVVLIEIESSFTPLYEFEIPHHKLISMLMDKGFVPIKFGNVHEDSRGRVWQLDTLLIKSELL